jgi:hypothetical protein
MGGDGGGGARNLQDFSATIKLPHLMHNQTSAIEAPGTETFRQRFCRLNNCPPQEYERRVLLACLHTKSAWLARLYFKVDRENFKGDLEMIRILGKTTDYGVFKQEMEAWRSSHPSKGYLRKKLQIRVSGKNLLKLASRVYKSPAFFGLAPTRPRVAKPSEPVSSGSANPVKRRSGTEEDGETAHPG